MESAWHRLANIRFFAHAIFSPPAADTWANDTVCRWLSARRANQCCKRKTPVAACRRAPPMARLRLIAGVRHGLGSEKARAEVDPIAQQHERKQQAGAAEDDDGAERFDIDLETGGARKHSGKGGHCSLQQNPENSVSASITASAPYRCEAVHVSRIREGAPISSASRPVRGARARVHAMSAQIGHRGGRGFWPPVFCAEARSTRRSLERKKGHLRWQEALSLGRKRPMRAGIAQGAIPPLICERFAQIQRWSIKRRRYGRRSL